MPVNFTLKKLQAQVTTTQNGSDDVTKPPKEPLVNPKRPSESNNGGAAAEKPQEPASASPINPNQNEEGGAAQKPRELRIIKGSEITVKTGIEAYKYFFNTAEHNSTIVIKKASGGFGAVFEHMEPKLQKYVIKVQQKRQSTKDELEILKFLSKQKRSKHLLNLINYTTMPLTDLVYEALLFPKMDSDFFDYLSTEERPNQAKLDIFIGSLKGLEHLHGLGILHRDFKLENILVKQQDGRVLGLLCDYGFAAFNTETDKLKQTSGTIPYTPPLMIKALVNNIITKRQALITQLTDKIGHAFLSVSIEGKLKKQEIQILREHINYQETEIEKLKPIQEILSETPDHAFNVKCELYMTGLVALQIFVNHSSLPHYNKHRNELDYIERIKATITDNYETTNIDSKFKAALYNLIREQVCTKPQHQLPTIKTFREEIVILS
jgi:serine/threonine protein kinase